MERIETIKQIVVSLERLFLFLLMTTMLNGCKGRGDTPTVDEEEDEDEVIHAEMQYFDFDQVDDLSAFFDSIQKVHGIPLGASEPELTEEIEDLERCIAVIDSFRQGRVKYFPETSVKKFVSLLGGSCADINNHGPDVDMTYAEWFLMMAAYYSPDITCMVHMQTPNHCAGILNFGASYNDAPWWCYLLLKRSKGFEVRRIKENDVRIDKLFQIEDENHRLYYLCSNNGLVGFLQILYWVKSVDDVVMVAQCDGFPADYDLEFDECYYHPEQKAWYCCNRDKRSGKMIPVSEQPVLELELDGEHSSFVKGGR